MDGSKFYFPHNSETNSNKHDESLNMTTLAGGFLVTNYNDAVRKVSKINLD